MVFGLIFLNRPGRLGGPSCPASGGGKRDMWKCTSLSVRRALNVLQVIVVATLTAGILVTGAARAADTSYLAAMPPAQRVLQGIKGNDPTDTAAKQAASFTHLMRMMNARIGDPDANLNQGRLSPAERELMQSYNVAAASVLRPVFAKFDLKCQGPNCDDTKFRQLISNYQNSAALQSEVEKFFTAQWLADYRRDFQRMQASLAAQNKQQQTRDQVAAEAQLRAGLQNYLSTQSWNAFMEENFGYLLMGGLVALYVRRRMTRKSREQK